MHFNKSTGWQVACLITLCILNITARAQSKEPYELNINGVKVIVQPSGNEIVEIETYIKGGVQNYKSSEAGIESLALNALTECGTVNDNKNSFKNKLDQFSAQMYGNAEMDYSSFTVNCIKSDFESVWPLYVDALTAPAFDSIDFKRIRQDAINSLKAQSSEPDYSINKLARTTAFAGKEYAKSPEGEENTVKQLSADRTKSYYFSVLTRSRLLIVVVGDLDKATIQQKLESLLSKIPAGNPFVVKKEQLTTAKNTFKAEKKDLATNYIQAVTGAPLPGSSDFDAFNLAMRIFYDRQFLEIRTNNGLSYAPYTYFDIGFSPSANIDVSTTDPNKYIAKINGLITQTKKKGFTDEELKNMKTTYLTQFYYRQETNSAQGRSLAESEIHNNNWRRAIELNEIIKKVSLDDVNKAFNKYLTHYIWVYQGDPSKVNPALYLSNDLKNEKTTQSSLKSEGKN